MQFGNCNYEKNAELALVMFSSDNFLLNLSTKRNKRLKNVSGGARCHFLFLNMFNVVLQAQLMLIVIGCAGYMLWSIENCGKQPKLWSYLTGVGETDFFTRTAENNLNCSCL